MEYISVLGFQLKVDLDCDSKNEFLIRNKELDVQLKHMKELIEDKNPDIIVLPEMCYLDDMEKYYRDISKESLVVAGGFFKW